MLSTTCVDVVEVNADLPYSNFIIIYNSNYNEIHNENGVSINLSRYEKYSYQEIIDLILI